MTAKNTRRAKVSGDAPATDAATSSDERRLVVPIDSVHPDPENARERTPRNLASVRASLEAFGQQKPIVVEPTTGKVIAGNGTWLVAKELGWKTIWITRSDLTGAHAAAYAVVDNRASDQSQFDEGQLVLTLGALPKDLLAATGFDVMEIEELMPRTLTSVEDEVAASDGRDALTKTIRSRPTLKLLLSMQSVARIERAIHHAATSTGTSNREQALLEVVAAYEREAKLPDLDEVTA